MESQIKKPLDEDEYTASVQEKTSEVNFADDIIRAHQDDHEEHKSSHHTSVGKTEEV